MSKGSPIVKARVSHDLYRLASQAVIRLHNTDASLINTMSDLINVALLEFLQKSDRRRRSAKRARERKRLAAHSEAESKRIFDEMQAELSKYK